MPSFVCDTCQETLKKAKLDQHTQRCRQASFSCIDCYKTFKGNEYRAHTSCITEVQKHHTIKNKQGELMHPQKRQHQETVAKVEEKKAAEVSPKKEKKAEEMELVLSKLTKEPKSLKDVLKAIKKGSEDKKARKAAKKWLQMHTMLSLDASGNAVTFKLE